MYVSHDDSIIYSLPYKKGQAYKVIQGYNGSFSHHGDDQYAVDFGMPEGTFICAARDGMVVGVKDNSNIQGGSKDSKHKANYVLIRHSDGTIGEYHHLKRKGVLVNIGQKIRKGHIIGLSGNTGWSTVPHLHFGVYKSIDGKRRKSFPVTFQGRNRIITNPVEGEFYISQ
jgi:murein DD-endopeptidase MepM/ murein hydrolase activator NlpD